MATAPAGPGPELGSKQNPVNARVSGSLTPYNDLANPNQYRVNFGKELERITQPLYSYQPYPAAGASTLSFFVNPASGTTTQEDTNMQLAGQLPAPQKFLVQGIGIDYLSGSTAAPPVIGPRADASTGMMNDMWAILRRGLLTLTIGSKPYFSMAPLMSMPPRSHLGGVGAAATNLTTGAATQTLIDLAYCEGPVFPIIPLLLEASQNFRVTIDFPGGAVAVPSTDALARIGVILYGTLYRPAQ